MRRLLLVFLMLGLISLLADMVYEGARSASGAFLEFLGAPAIASSIIGLGEFIGYILRFIGAYIATSLGSSTAFWGLIAIGYGLNVLVIPLLALAPSWEVATMIFLVERVGKGLRAPLRDVVLAEVSEDMGRGRGFGIHELMDQIGALSGPAIFAYLLAISGYRVAFMYLIVPGVLAMILVFTAWSLYPKLKSIGHKQRVISVRGLGEKYWLYTASMSLQAMGFIHWAIASYLLKQWGVLEDHMIALLYALAMGVDAAIALPIGILYDRVRYKTLYIVPLSTLIITPLILTRNTHAIIVASCLWGIVMGASETIMRASIADIVKPESLAIGYGLFGMIYGLSWGIGGFLITGLIAISPIYVALYILITQLASLILLFILTGT